MTNAFGLSPVRLGRAQYKYLSMGLQSGRVARPVFGETSRMFPEPATEESEI